MAQKCAVCAIAKNEGKYIEEWARFHLGLGFQHIAIYDNESVDDGMSKIQMMPGISVIPWRDAPNKKAQNTAYEDFFFKTAKYFDWIICLDIDEFLNLKQARTVSEFLEGYTDADGVAVNWRMFGSSGHERGGSDSVLSRFTRASVREFGPNAHVKTLYRPSGIERPFVHSPLFKTGATLVDCQHRRLNAQIADTLNHNIDFDLAQINHYFTKSKEEFAAKIARGKADHAPESAERHRTLEEFALYDRNEEYDDTITRLIFDEGKVE